MMQKFKLLTLCVLLCAGFVNAKEHTVKLLTQGSGGKMMVFEPIFIKIAVGDTINFVPSDATHNAESFSVPSEKSSFSTPYGEATKITFSEKGVVLVKCVPHTALGMMGVIQVGDNVDSAKAQADWSKARASVAMNKEAVDEAISKIK
jgi:pseudoazurin